MRVGYIAPNQFMKNRAEEVFKNHNYNVEIVIGNIKEGAMKAKKMLKEKKIDAFIARGATATSLREITDIPVIEILITLEDIAEAINIASEYGEKICIIGFYNLIGGFEKLNPLLNIKVKQIYLESEDEIYTEIKKAKEEGIEVIIGGEVQCSTAEELGLKGVFLESSSQSILNAYLHAEDIYKSILKGRKESKEINTIMDNIEEGFIVLDDKGKVSLINNYALELMGYGTFEAVDCKFIMDNFKRIPETLETGIETINNIVNIKGTSIAYNTIPILVEEDIVGVVANFSQISKLQETEQDIRTKVYLDGLYARYTFPQIAGESQKIKNTIEIAKNFAKTNSTVLLIGETGTGKELFAQSIHNYSARVKHPFVAINCASLPENILESELFGYVEGAFTGARKKGKLGFFELAHGGTLFLDEINAIPLGLQGRLLRALEENSIMKLGDDKIIPVDVRIIAASNEDLEELVKRGDFRADLFYRINVLKLEIPPLRDRKEDIEILIDIFIKRFFDESDGEDFGLDGEVLDLLLRYDWPGNVRELKNVIKRFIILNRCNIKEEDIIGDLLQSTLKDHRKNEDISIEEVKGILRALNNNKTKAAEVLGVSRTTLWRWLKNVQ